jgi:hypothetical protein
MQITWNTFFCLLPYNNIGNRFKKSICLFLNPIVELLLFCLYMSVIPINMFIPIVTFGFIAPKHFKLSVPDEAYSTNVPCTLNLISTFILLTLLINYPVHILPGLYLWPPSEAPWPWFELLQLYLYRPIKHLIFQVY